MTGEEAPFDLYFRAVSEVDTAAAVDVVLELHDGGEPAARITERVLAPAQVRVGELWEQGTWSVADEHAATAVTETALAALHATERSRVAARRHVVLACAEGEWHALPARMAAAVASVDPAVRVTMLGASLPADALGTRLAAGDVDLLALSCTLPTNLIGAARCVAAAHDAGVPVLAGGRAFGSTPQRAHAVGADGWAADPAALTGPVPLPSGRVSDIPLEALLLDTVGSATVAVAYDRLVEAFPRLQEMSPYQQARTREDLAWMARFTGAAVLTDDPTVLDDFFDWIGRLLRGKVPVPVLATSAHVLAESVEPQAPVGAQLLHEAARRFEAADG